MTDYVLNPVGEPAPSVQRASLAPRPGSLENKRIGILDDRVTRSIGNVTEVLGPLVEQTFAPRSVRVWLKPNTGAPSPRALLEDVMRNSDVVILACCA